MKAAPESTLSDSAFIVLSIIAEGKTYGYDIIKTIHNRGFRFWTDLRRSASYNALLALEKQGLVTSELQPGVGPDKKVYKITDAGRKRLNQDAIRHLSSPGHPRSEIDLGIYAIPFIGSEHVHDALSNGLKHLTERRAFLKERLNWCKEKGLIVPALAFERPLLALEAEITWLKKLRTELHKKPTLKKNEWQSYEYKEPPDLSDEA